jgi:hypothetical protein
MAGLVDKQVNPWIGKSEVAFGGLLLKRTRIERKERVMKVYAIEARAKLKGRSRPGCRA